MPVATLEEVFIHELADIYDAEHQFLDAQQQLAQKAANPELQRGMLKHVEETQQHVRNLEQVFEAVGQSPKRQTCDGAKGLVKEGSIMAEEATGPVRDVVIVEAAEKVEAYEIMGYTSLISAAKALGQEEAASLLERNLSDEERMAEQLAGVEAVVRDAMSE